MLKLLLMHAISVKTECFAVTHKIIEFISLSALPLSLPLSLRWIQITIDLKLIAT